MDSQTLYCLNHIRRQHCKNPVENRGHSRQAEVVETVTLRGDLQDRWCRNYHSEKSNQNILAK